ncbi:MAG: mobile mystery protein A [Verrucomicrobia bacterium]|nr:mobile mystery protein A [Verrucomicrobiota bacterium]
MKTAFLALSRQQVDEKLTPWKSLVNPKAPPCGWIRAIRSSLGMRGVDFAQRLGIAPASASALEQSEAAGTISLKSLRKAAEVLDCDLVYALVPRKGLTSAMERRAGAKADEMLGNVNQTMRLEAQGVDSLAARKQSRETIIKSLLEKPSSLWK